MNLRVELVITLNSFFLGTILPLMDVHGQESRSPDVNYEIVQYMLPGKNVDSNALTVREKAQQLTGSIVREIEKARVLFEFVRDSIDEGNFQGTKASDVLKVGNGFCHNKAILLTALSRAAGIPARIAFDEVLIHDYIAPGTGKKSDVRFLHGLTEMYLGGKWIKVDQTGNAKRWRIWTGPDSGSVSFQLPLPFRPDADVLFPSNAKVRIERTPFHFFDWTDETVELTDRFKTY